MKPHDPTSAPSPSGRHPEAVRGPVVLCSDAWFDLGGTASCLRVAVATPVNLDGFSALVRLGDQMAVVEFSFLAFIKGRHIFEASRVSLERDQDQSSQDLSFRLSGPFQGGLRVAS